jgi:hypothetical protein
VTRLLVALALLAVAVAAVAAPGPRPNDDPRPVLARASAPLAHSNSRDGHAVLTASGLQPGDRRSGEVTIRNEGGAGGLALVTHASGPLAERLRLTVADDGGAEPVDASLAAVPVCVPLGGLPAGAARTYRFQIAFERGPGDDSLAGASARADFEWRDSCVPEPAAPLELGDVRVALAPGPYRFAGRTGTARVGVRCLTAASGACRGRLELERRTSGQGRGIALAVGRIDVAAGARSTATLRLNGRARRRVAGRGVLAVRAYLTVRDAQGRPHRVARRERLLYRP